MLVLDSLHHQFPDIKKGEIFLSGFRKLDKSVENRWDWTKPGDIYRKNYLQFLDYIKQEYDYKDDPYCCLFILEILPRIFLEKYLNVKNKKIGMLEYKIPIYTKIFDIPVHKRDVGVFWFGNWKDYPLNAMPYEIETGYIVRQLKKPDGWRIFHPYFKHWPSI